MFSTLHALTVIHKKTCILTHTVHPPHQHTVTNTIPMMYKRGLLIDVYRRRAGQRFENQHAVNSASAGLLVHQLIFSWFSAENQRRSNSSLHLQSPVTKLARAGARASKSVNNHDSLISIFFLKKKDIFKSPYDVLLRNKNRLNDSSWRIYVYCSLLESPE